MFISIGKSTWGHSRRRLDCPSRLIRIWQQEGAKFTPKKTTGVESFQLFFLAHSLESLTNINKSRHRLISLPQHFGHPRPNMRCCHRLRRNVSGMPMILVPGMQNMPKVRLHRRANQRSFIHHLRNFLKAFREIDSTYRGWNRRKSATNIRHFKALSKRFVVLRIKSIRRCHASTHP